MKQGKAKPGGLEMLLPGKGAGERELFGFIANGSREQEKKGGE